LETYLGFLKSLLEKKAGDDRLFYCKEAWLGFANLDKTEWFQSLRLVDSTIWATSAQLKKRVMGI
jgi:hypothetical protein